MPTQEQAKQFALMLQSGLPAQEAILYFTDSQDPGEIARMLQGWLQSRAVRAASQALLRRPWTEMDLNEKISLALDQHYAGLAHFIFTHNYAGLNPMDKAKADTARVALEAKIAGTAGKLDALSQFAADLNSGKLKLTRPAGSQADPGPTH